MRPPRSALSRRKESASFWKKKQKLLPIGVRVGSNARPNVQKFFGSFFKKELLASPEAQTKSWRRSLLGLRRLAHCAATPGGDSATTPC
jgi:hypothetical protein